MCDNIEFQVELIVKLVERFSGRAISLEQSNNRLREQNKNQDGEIIARLAYLQDKYNDMGDEGFKKWKGEA